MDYMSKIESDSLMSKLTNHKDALTELKRLEQKFEASQEKIELYRTYEQTLDVPKADIPQIDQFQTNFARREKIWKNWDTFQTQKKNWYLGNFKDQDAEEIVKIVNNYGKQNMELKMKMQKGDVDEVLDELMKEVKVVDSHKGLI